MDWGLWLVSPSFLASHLAADLENMFDVPGTKNHKATCKSMILKEVETGTAVQKVGQMTGHTRGYLNGIDASRRVKPCLDNNNNPLVSKEATIIPTGRDSPRFSDSGDSGSLVLSNKAEMVGMVFGGSAEGEVSLYTPVVPLMEDIKKKTGGLILKPFLRFDKNFKKQQNL